MKPSESDFSWGARVTSCLARHRATFGRPSHVDVGKVVHKNYKSLWTVFLLRARGRMLGKLGLWAARSLSILGAVPFHRRTAHRGFCSAFIRSRRRGSFRHAHCLGPRTIFRGSHPTWIRSSASEDEARRMVSWGLRVAAGSTGQVRALPWAHERRYSGLPLLRDRSSGGATEMVYGRPFRRVQDLRRVELSTQGSLEVRWSLLMSAL